MKKIYTRIILEGNLKKVEELSGKITTEDFELILDFLDIVWQPHFNYIKVARSSLKEIKKVVAKYNKDIEDL